MTRRIDPHGPEGWKVQKSKKKKIFGSLLCQVKVAARGGGGVNSTFGRGDSGDTVGGLEFDAHVRRLDRLIARGELLPY